MPKKPKNFLKYLSTLETSTLPIKNRPFKKYEALNKGIEEERLNLEACIYLAEIELAKAMKDQSQILSAEQVEQNFASDD